MHVCVCVCGGGFVFTCCCLFVFASSRLLVVLSTRPFIFQWLCFSRLVSGVKERWNSKSQSTKRTASASKTLRTSLVLERESQQAQHTHMYTPESATTAISCSVPLKCQSTCLAFLRTKRRFSSCENTVLELLKARFRKISRRSNYLCGQRWGFLEQIFISGSRKRPATTG